jgi:DNA-binding Xre family transcriptional regulator
MSTNPALGSSFDDFLTEDNLLETVEAIALKRVIAWQLAQEMNKRGLTKTQMAQAMQTSRSSLNRLLDPENSAVTLNTLTSAAHALGKRLHIELVDA